MESSEIWEKEPLSPQKSQILLSLPRNRSLCVKVRDFNTTQIFLIKFTFILQFYIAIPSTVVSYMSFFPRHFWKTIWNNADTWIKQLKTPWSPLGYKAATSEQIKLLPGCFLQALELYSRHLLWRVMHLMDSLST